MVEREGFLTAWQRARVQLVVSKNAHTHRWSAYQCGSVLLRGLPEAGPRRCPLQRLAFAALGAGRGCQGPLGTVGLSKVLQGIHACVRAREGGWGGVRVRDRETQ